MWAECPRYSSNCKRGGITGRWGVEDKEKWMKLRRTTNNNRLTSEEERNKKASQKACERKRLKEWRRITMTSDRQKNKRMSPGEKICEFLYFQTHNKLLHTLATLPVILFINQHGNLNKMINRQYLLGFVSQLFDTVNKRWWHDRLFHLGSIV